RGAAARPASPGDVPQDDRLGSAPHHRPVEPAQDRVRQAARSGLPGGADEALLARARPRAARHVELPAPLQGVQVGAADRRARRATAVRDRLFGAALALSDVVSLYEERLGGRGFVSYPSQRRAVERLQRLYEEWSEYKKRRSTALKRLLVHPELPKGV